MAIRSKLGLCFKNGTWVAREAKGNIFGVVLWLGRFFALSCLVDPFGVWFCVWEGLKIGASGPCVSLYMNRVNSVWWHRSQVSLKYF